ncbi:MAG: hypothetical protein KGL53_12595, partial [Elusimicrobia bacterium]|nr:hypothetical protein [Elusimicrobiota bacterium]
VARRLRGWPRAALRGFLLQELPKDGGAGLLREVLEGRLLGGAEVGLAYGISHKDVKKQFRRYLLGLAARAAADKTSFVIATPSAFGPEDVVDYSELVKRVRFVSRASEVPPPAKAEPGKVYILKTGTLPHAAFIGLMAYSVPPPVVAGDGAMSAAIALGRPFVLTRVGWNKDNIDAYAQRLAARTTDPETRRLIKRVYGKIQLEYAQHLEDLPELFDGAARDIPVLTDTLAAAVRALRGLYDRRVPVEALLQGLDDPSLQASLLMARVGEGDRRAMRLARAELHGGPLQEELASVVLHEAGRRYAFLKPLGSLDAPWVRAWAARLVMRLMPARSWTLAPRS